MKKSIYIIDERIKNPKWVPMPYSHADWLIKKLLDCGWTIQDDKPPHFKLSTGELNISISPFPNVVILNRHERSFIHELYCHPSIPQNEDEFDDFFQLIKKLL